MKNYYMDSFGNIVGPNDKTCRACENFDQFGFDLWCKIAQCPVEPNDKACKQFKLCILPSY